ncbi:MAG: hypothetical protein NVSMB18_32690 [Acetobacteraceae bacterium]
MLPSSPAFGEADLSNCEREQIHLAGSIQPHGALLVLREPDYVVVQASANAQSLLGLDADPVGMPLAAFPGNLASCISPHLNVPLLHSMPLAVRAALGSPVRHFDVALHRPPQGGIVIELEPATPPANRTRAVEDAIQRILAAYSLRALCDDTARIVRELTGYDRVMLYRFDPEGHGEVFAEERADGLEPFLGNRYPATDIPQIARRLYERNRVRVLVDIGYTPVPVVPELSPLTGQPLDMSLCLLRSVSPIHVQYLKNMGVCATLVVSLMAGGRLWGLVACHHHVPRIVPFEMRVVCELLGEAVATRIAALESSARGQAELAVRRLEQRLVESIPREGDWRGALFDSAPSLLQPLRATGAALLFENQVMVAGDVPGTQQVRELGQWLDGRRGEPVFATASLGLDEPAFAELRRPASGVVAVALSASPGEYLVWFRPERVRTVTWGGDPRKAVVVGATPMDLSPRRSFAQWHQLVEQTCDPWTEADLVAARLIGETVKDVILQFRSVGMLIAHEQLERVRAQVRRSELPVVVADAHGNVLLVNDAFRAMIGQAERAPGQLADLTAYFTDPAEFSRRLQDLTQGRLTWRGEVKLRASARPLLVRADPVLASPGQVSGFVLLFTDLTQQKAAEAARQSFQERILERGRLASRFDPTADVLMQNLFASVVENAQLAALEITDGVDLEAIPAMLDSVRASVARTKRALDHLILHANSLAAKDTPT